MANITIQMEEKLYPKSEYRAGGNAVSTKVFADGSEIGLGVFEQNAVYVDVLEDALAKVVLHIRANEYEAAAVTVVNAPGFTLPASVTGYLSGKYSVQSEIASITFE